MKRFPSEKWKLESMVSGNKLKWKAELDVELASRIISAPHQRTNNDHSNASDTV